MGSLTLQPAPPTAHSLATNGTILGECLGAVTLLVCVWRSYPRQAKDRADLNRAAS